MPPSRPGRSRALPPLDVEALWQLKRIGNPTLSPDGRVACAAVTSFAMDTNESRTELWLFPTGLGEGNRGAGGKGVAAIAPSGDRVGAPSRLIAHSASTVSGCFAAAERLCAGFVPR